MFKSGIIFRLIDVAFITLFGFIGITDMDIKSQIKLPSAFESGAKNIKQQFVFLTIKNDTLFELLDDKNIVNTLKGLEKLDPFLAQLNNHYRQQYEQMVVVIEPDLESHIQTTVNVMDICEKHGIQRNLSYSQIELK